MHKSIFFELRARGPPACNLRRSAYDRLGYLDDRDWTHALQASQAVESSVTGRDNTPEPGCSQQASLHANPSTRKRRSQTPAQVCDRPVTLSLIVPITN